MATMKMKNKCKVPFCDSKYFKGDNIVNKHFFALPTSSEKRKQWIEAINSGLEKKIDFSEQKTYLICENHFLDGSFTSTEKKRIHKYAVPSVFSCYPLISSQCSNDDDNKTLCSDFNMTINLEALAQQPQTSPNGLQEEKMKTECNNSSHMPTTSVCWMAGCHNRTGPFCRFPNPKVHLYRFRQWVQAVDNSRLRGLCDSQIFRRGFVCHNHFKSEDFESGSNKLHCIAVPTLNLHLDTSLPQTLTSEGYDLLKKFNLVDSRVLEVSNDLPDRNNVLSVDPNCFDETRHLEKQSDHVGMSLSQADHKIITEKSQNQEVGKPYFRSVKSFLQDCNRMTEVCRICFQSLEEEEVIKLYEQSSQEDVVQIKKMLQLILPDLDLEVYPNTVICVKCAELLVYSYQLKEKWLATEEKLHKIIKKEKGLLNRNADLVIIGKRAVTNVSDIDHDYAGNPPLESPPERKVTNAILKNLAENLESECSKKVSIFHGNLNSTNLASFKPMKRVVKPKKRTNPDLGSYMCEQCGQMFTSRRGFIRHSKVHLESPKRKSKKRTIMCEICGNLFATTYSLSLHKQKHSDLKCGFCDRVFNSRRQRHVHINSKHLQKTNQCHLCGKQFSYRTSLDVHLKVHNPANRTKACNICDKKFFETAKLKKHLQSHIEGKLLKCDYCGKFLKHKLSLEKHIKIYHLNEGKFVCEFCNKPYWKRRDLEKHRLRLHQNQPIEESNEVFNEENCAVNSIQQTITFNV